MRHDPNLPDHPYSCECSLCWADMTNIMPKPPTIWQRIKTATKGGGDAA